MSQIGQTANPKLVDFFLYPLIQPELALVAESGADAWKIYIRYTCCIGCHLRTLMGPSPCLRQLWYFCSQACLGSLSRCQQFVWDVGVHLLGNQNIKNIVYTDLYQDAFEEVNQTCFQHSRSRSFWRFVQNHHVRISVAIRTVSVKRIGPSPHRVVCVPQLEDHRRMFLQKAMHHRLCMLKNFASWNPCRG